MNPREQLDISAYLVIGPENTEGRAVGDVIAQAIEGGFTCFQIRSKVASARELIEFTREAADAIAKAGKADSVVLLVNDRLDVALAARDQGIKVDGIHVGQTDIPVEVCRAYLGPEAVIGLSARTDEMIEHIKTEDVSEVDYFGVAPLHETATKPDCGLAENGEVVVRTLDELSELAAISPRPVVVGGGVKASDIPELKSTGVDGFFVVSAVCAAEDPYAAARKLVDAWKSA